ncbi:BtrH N-terminal domain-containing protein [Halobacterium yunchengense]|uniref:BtrH N-terminal domain-containing protein n=1 Tax=Halobacterium yunchengense TaxID=3108497 RepID=UPI003009A062
MESVDGYPHQQGAHCGAAALRNVTAYYGLDYSEAECFGIGGGPAFVRYEPPDADWAAFRASPTWLERAFFERTGIPHRVREGDDFETAWANVAGHVAEDDPVLLFLDPARLDYLPDSPAHVPPHVAVVVGYDEETVRLSDAAMPSLQSVSRAALRDAWAHERFGAYRNEYLVVTNAQPNADETDAIAAGLRQTATYMLEPLQVERDARGPGDEGLPALRSFGDSLGRWADLPDPTRAVRAAERTIDEHGEGAAFRGLYAESLGELGRRTGLPPDVDDRMDGVAAEWRRVAAQLDEIAAAADPEPGAFEEAASRVADLADREEAICRTLRDELGGHGD